jgi:hypothetical protein
LTDCPKNARLPCSLTTCVFARHRGVCNNKYLQKIHQGGDNGGKNEGIVCDKNSINQKQNRKKGRKEQ